MIGTTASFVKTQIDAGLIRVPIARSVGSARSRSLMRLKMSVVDQKQTWGSFRPNGPADGGYRPGTAGPSAGSQSGHVGRRTPALTRAVASRVVVERVVRRIHVLMRHGLRT